jgi:lipoprotein-anchoring transpeptidase ErfK/SrfK
MIRFHKTFSAAFLCGITFLLAACAPQQQQQPNNAPSVQTNTNVSATPAPPTAAQTPNQQAASNLPVTLPVLDAMFADEAFATELKSKLNLTDEQIERLRQASQEAVNNLDANETEGSTAAATRRAEEQIRAIVGEQKATELANFIRQRWGGGEEFAAVTGEKPNAVPTDTRIVVNAPAYRMDVFKDGQLVKTYKVGIGYPEFPLPTGVRRAQEIIFNPTWTPPDEPWVKGKYKPFEKVEAGSKLNPLGPIKIPIGLPSLIHGGKDQARLGTFASHGCVGLTNPQVQDFSLVLAQISGTELSPEDVANYEKQKTETKNVKLAAAIPVELRYETIVVEDGKLRIYRDVYERGTNTEENARKVLQAYGVSYDSLSEQEKSQIANALRQMSLDPQGKPADGQPNANASNANNANRKSESNKNADSSGKVTRNIKGQKEVVIEIAALQGKGYPAPVELNTGQKSKTASSASAGNSNAKPASSSPNRQSGR